MSSLKLMRNDHYQMTELLEALRKAEKIVLFSHISPDGDTVGSALALQLVLQRLGKTVILVLDGVVPANISFLLTFGKAMTPVEAAEMDMEAAGTLAVAVDVSCESRMGAAEALFWRAPLTAQVDHHETNPGYAQINLIDGEASATALLVARIQHELDVPFEQAEAICLYTALSTDTGNFLFENTSAEAFGLMQKLMEVGLPLAKYGRELFMRKQKAFVKLLGKVLPTLTFLCDGKIAGITLTYQQMCDVDAKDEHTDGLVNYVIDICGVRMAYFARETASGAMKVSLRALSPYRVDDVAAIFDGGGHHLAAGCTINRPMPEAVQQIEKALTEALLEGSQQL